MTRPRPNLRIVSDDPSYPDHLDLWSLERQACGLEPGELALSRPYAVMTAKRDVFLYGLVACLVLLLILDVWHAIVYLMEVKP